MPSVVLHRILIEGLAKKSVLFWQALFDYQPNSVDEQQSVAWLALMERAYCNFQRYAERIQ